MRHTAVLALLALLLEVPSACARKARSSPFGASASESARATFATPPRAPPGSSSSARPRALSDAAVSSALPLPLDAGVNACRLALGPIQQPWTGDAALLSISNGVELVTHRAGVPTVTRITAPALNAPKFARVGLEVVPDRVSSPPCAVAGDYVFCMDAEGAIHRTPRAGGVAAIVARGRPGSRLGAEVVGGTHAVVAFLMDRPASLGIVREAYAVVDDSMPVRISEEGSGASSVALLRRGLSVVAMLVDARSAMTPVHARALEWKEGGLTVGPDAVLFVGGGAEAHTSGVVASSASGASFALIPVAGETGFGMAAVRLDDPPAVDAPTVWSMYPNGLDPAPIAATTGTSPIRIARVRPVDARPDSPRGIEVGKLDDRGTFTPHGLLSTTGRVSSVALAADAAGTLWIYYTDAAGSWLERRVCP